MIELRDIGFSYSGPMVIHDVTTQIGPGEIVGVIGPSGAGKTTLLRILLGELVPTHGSLRVGNRSRLSVGYVPQLEAGERSFPITVEETVLLGCAAMSLARPWFSRAERRHAHAILQRLSISHLRYARLDELSGGQLQRVLIGRALMSRPNFLILDEPTSGIDLKTRSQVLELIEDLSADGYTVVLSTHDLNWVAAHLPRIMCLNKTIIADGSPLEVLTSDVVAATYGADMDVLIHNGRPVVVDSMPKEKL